MDKVATRVALIAPRAAAPALGVRGKPRPPRRRDATPNPDPDPNPNPNPNPDPNPNPNTNPNPNPNPNLNPNPNPNQVPTLFTVLWNAMNPFIDPVTRAKIVFVTGSAVQH